MYAPSQTKYEEVMKEVEASQVMEVGGKVPSFYEIRKHATVMNQASQGGEKLARLIVGKMEEALARDASASGGASSAVPAATVAAADAGGRRRAASPAEVAEALALARGGW